MLAPEDIRNKLFSVVRLRTGYDQRQVDSFLDQVDAELSSRAARLDHVVGSEGLTDESASLAVTLTGADALATSFSTVRLREGYERTEVDDFLREVASTLDQVDADLRRHGVRVTTQPRPPQR